MSSDLYLGGAIAAADLVLGELADAGIAATDDAGAFHPAPLGVLVGLPSLIERGLASRTYEVPVHVVCADNLSRRSPRAAFYQLAEQCVGVLRTPAYAVTEWVGGVNVEPVPQALILVEVTIPEV